MSQVFLFVCAHGDQKRTSDPPVELEFEVDARHMTWVLETELMSSGRT